MAFTTLIGDAQKAEETLLRLRELGAQTPFEFPELADAGRKLIAFGESADSVPETLRRIGDISAGIQAPVNQIAELYAAAGDLDAAFEWLDRSREDHDPGLVWSIVTPTLEELRQDPRWQKFRDETFTL